MGIHLDNIKKSIKAKSTLATIAIVPAVLAGLTLLGFQTYSLITGKSFRDLNFDIGRLWESGESLENVDLIETSESTRNIFQDILTKTEASLEERIKNLRIPTVIAKQASLVQPNKVETSADVRERSTFELYDLTLIENVDLSGAFQSKQLLKYFSRLENEYLINPDMIPRQGKWYIGFSFSPTLNYRTFSYDPSLVNGVAIDGDYRYTFGLTEASRNLSDKSITSYTIGIDFGRRISKRLSLFSGFHYAHYGEQVQVRAANRDNPNYESATFINRKPEYEIYSTEDNSLNIPYTNKYSYFEIPLGVSFDFIQLNKSKVTIDAGISLQKLDHVNALVYDFDTDYYYWMNRKDQIFREYGIGSSAGITLSQFVGERLEIFVNPHFKMNLNSTFKKPYPVNQNQYSSGLRLGMKHHIL
ncbi:MAG: hypothetical protein COA58_01965 [Bacteroidetes bacterium]|nr:MAG: hypothetical protein COA58_01965 [Bacteroidota bacterium]